MSRNQIKYELGTAQSCIRDAMKFLRDLEQDGYDDFAIGYERAWLESISILIDKMIERVS